MAGERQATDKDALLTAPPLPSSLPLLVADRPGPVPAAHPGLMPRKVGVLLINLGTPDGTDYWSLRRYLGQFLADPRVVEIPRLLWLPLLHGVILSLRPQRSAHAYKRIWNQAHNESPLKTITRAQAEAVAQRLADESGDTLVVGWAMRYGNPSMDKGLHDLVQAGCDRILLFPLYPQYSAATTATACDEAFRALMRMRRQPSLRTAPPYYDDPAYIEALAAHARKSLDALDWQPDRLILSFHGLPRQSLDLGDPYHCHCLKTARLLTERMGWPADRALTAFQSRFGRARWLEPYLEPLIRSLPGQGIRSVAVIAPGFASDCVETLEEVQMAIRDVFLQSGGTRFAYLPCLNDDPLHIKALSALIMRELSGWLTSEG
jgi:protoporphyrin/coproporphyrin ferrochelatase